MLACFMRSDSEECAKKNTKWGCVCTPGIAYTIVRIHLLFLGPESLFYLIEAFVANVSVQESGQEREMNSPPFSIFFLLSLQLSRNNSIGNACYASCERRMSESVKILSSPCLPKGGKGWIKHEMCLLAAS